MEPRSKKLKDLIVNYTTKCPICLSYSKKYKESIISPFISERAFGFTPFTINKNWDLKDIEDTKIYFPSRSIFCDKCNFLFCSIRFNDNQLKSIYENYRKYSYNLLRKKYETNYQTRSVELDKGYAYIKDIEKQYR